MARPGTKSLIQFVVLLSIGIALIWFSFSRITSEEKDAILRSFATADYKWVAISMVICVLSHLLRAYRWNLLLEPAGHRVTLANGFCHVMIGYLANYGIPRMGEITRCTLAAKYDKVPFEVALGTVITERIVDLVLFGIIFFLTLIVEFSELSGLANRYVLDGMKAKLGPMLQNTTFMLGAAIVIISTAALIYLLRKRIALLLTGKVGKALRGILDGLLSIRHLRQPGKFVALSFMIWLCYFYSLYTCLNAIPETASLGHGACLTLLLFGTIGVMFSPGGLGAYPAIVSGILIATYNISNVSAFALPWLSWTSQFILIIIIGVISLAALPIINRKKDVLPQPAD
jgi:glycosyltransferase 2 family protein